jgi:hypothetical protein
VPKKTAQRAATNLAAQIAALRGGAYQQDMSNMAQSLGTANSLDTENQGFAKMMAIIEALRGTSGSQAVDQTAHKTGWTQTNSSGNTFGYL